MTQNQFLPSNEITYEHVTDEIVATYREQGFALVFAEEVMRYDLSLEVPSVAPLPRVSYLTWNTQSIPAFFIVYQAVFRERPGFPGWSEEEWIRWVADDPSFRPDMSFLAVVQEQAVGFVTNAEDEAASGRNGYMIQVGVHPQWRGQRVGAALVAHSLHAWQQEEKEAVLLHVNINNPEAILLYLQLGFELVGRRGKFRRQSEEDMHSIKNET